jgi:hypothetical protein
MIELLGLLSVLVQSEGPYDFISSETPRFYAFNCSDSLSLRHFPIESLSLTVRSSRQDLRLTAQSLITNVISAVPLSLESQENYFEANDVEVAKEAPQLLTFTCVTQEGSCGVSIVVSQSVTSRSGILAMGIVAIVLVGVDLSIVAFQFCTFHHKKHD